MVGQPWVPLTQQLTPQEAGVLPSQEVTVHGKNLLGSLMEDMVNAAVLQSSNNNDTDAHRTTAVDDEDAFIPMEEDYDGNHG